MCTGIAKRNQWEIPHTGATGAIRHTRAIGGNREAKSMLNYCSKTFRFRMCLAGNGSEINGCCHTFGRTMCPRRFRSKHLGEIAGPLTQGVLDPAKR